MDGFSAVVSLLPTGIRRALETVPETARTAVQEIRIRARSPLILSTPTGELLVSRDGVTAFEGAGTVLCSPETVRECFLCLCEGSVYAHGEELSRGFLTVPGGVRVGVGGCVSRGEDGRYGMREVTSLCIRVPRRHEGCAAVLREDLCGGGLHGLLLAGPPASGKTTLLRDAARQCASGRFGKRYRVCVVDEREELSAGLSDCDILAALPKPEAVERAVRCMAPDLIVFDELGDPAEAEALVFALNSGVRALGSVHAGSVDELLRRPSAAAALDRRIFDTVLLLEGREKAGQIARRVSLAEWEALRHDPMDRGTLHGGVGSRDRRPDGG